MTEPPIAHPWFAALYDRLTAAAERGFMARVRAEIVGSTRGRVLEIGRAERRAKEIGRPIALRQTRRRGLRLLEIDVDGSVTARQPSRQG